MKEFIQVVLSLIGVTGLIILLYVGLRMLNKRVSVISGQKLRILDRANLGKDSMLLVVSVCGKLMLIGVTSRNVEKIMDLEISETEYTGITDSSVSGIGFSDILNNLIGKKPQHSKLSEKENPAESSVPCEETDKEEADKDESNG